MPAIDISGCCIPAECNNIKLPYNGEIASRWDANLLYDICRHFASVMLHFASLISHNLRCIPAYAHLIPTGFFLLNYHRGNLYIISYFQFDDTLLVCIETCRGMSLRYDEIANLTHSVILWVQYKIFSRRRCATKFR